MEIKKIFFFFFLLGIFSCSDEPKVEQEPIENGTEVDGDSIELPESGDLIVYDQSPKGRKYRPIETKYSDDRSPVLNWTPVYARILAYLDGYNQKLKKYEDYKELTNIYGSDITKERYEATGRFYVRKADNGRFWIIDPEGYPYYLRGISSLQSGDDKVIFDALFGNTEFFIKTAQNELRTTGIHSMGAFSDIYEDIDTHNKKYIDAPLPQAPSFGFLSAFRKRKGYTWPGDDHHNRIGIVFYPGWEDFCLSYLSGSAFELYRGNKNVFGFFSDNELSFSADILESFLNLDDNTCPAYTAAVEYMNKNNWDIDGEITDEMNLGFLGEIAEIYYGTIAKAVDKVDPELLYLGSRIHGNVKYRESVIKAAGKYCDIISINYYGVWSPEIKENNWAKWAPDTPFLVSEFYTKSDDGNDCLNNDGAGFMVPTQKDRAFAYQHFTLGLLEATNCVGWIWFRYQDNDCNRGLFNKKYERYYYLSEFMKDINFNVYNIIDFFDK